jgi:DNA invertase Pin-like site-specific DNA recombinase
MLALVKKLEGYNVGLICSDQDIDTKSPAGRLLLTVLAAIAEFERELCSSRVKDGMARAKAEGKHIGHPKGQKNVNKRGHKKANPLYLNPASNVRKVAEAEINHFLYRGSGEAK